MEWIFNSCLLDDVEESEDGAIYFIN